MINPSIRKYFSKYGFSDKVLQVLSDSVLGSLENKENATEDEINEAAKNFDGLASAMQSDTDSKIAAASKKAPEKKSEESTGGSTGGEANESETLKAILSRLDNMEKKENSKGFNQKISEGLKTNHGLSDKQIESIMFGRTFETDDQVNEFLEAQKEFQETITQEVIEKKAGTGFIPVGSKGDSTKASIENDIKSFNEKY